MSETDPPGVDIPPHVSLRDLPAWEQHIWRTPGLTVEQREGLILFGRLERGDLLDDTAGLTRLYNQIGQILDRQPRPPSP